MLKNHPSHNTLSRIRHIYPYINPMCRDNSDSLICIIIICKYLIEGTYGKQKPLQTTETL
jgi:hypothetical protein